MPGRRKTGDRNAVRMIPKKRASAAKDRRSWRHFMRRVSAARTDARPRISVDCDPRRGSGRISPRPRPRVHQSRYRTVCEIRCGASAVVYAAGSEAREEQWMAIHDARAIMLRSVSGDISSRVRNTYSGEGLIRLLLNERRIGLRHYAVGAASLSY